MAQYDSVDVVKALDEQFGDCSTVVCPRAESSVIARERRRETSDGTDI